MTGKRKPINGSPTAFRLFSIAAALCLLGPIVESARAASQHPVNKEVAEAIAKHFVDGYLKDVDSAKYSAIHGADLPPAPFTGNRSWSVICGSVNSKNGFGGYSGPESFVVIVTSTTDAEVQFARKTKRQDFAKIWAMCDW